MIEAKEIRNRFLEKIKSLHPNHPLKLEYERTQARLKGSKLEEELKKEKSNEQDNTRN
jgi:hypothetical protein